MVRSKWFPVFQRKHPSRMVQVKYCSLCKGTKPTTDFHTRRASHDGLCSTCKLCRKAYKLAHRTEHENVSRARRHATWDKIVALMGPGCTDCGAIHPSGVYDLHHPDPSTKEKRFSPTWSWKHIEKYIIGTILLCPTCHRLRHLHLNQLKRKANEKQDHKVIPFTTKHRSAKAPPRPRRTHPVERVGQLRRSEARP